MNYSFILDACRMHRQYGFHDSCRAQGNDLEIHPVLWVELLTVFSE